MAEQDLIRIARDVVDAFNVSDWERSKVPLTPDTVYNEVGTQRSLKGPDEILGALQGWKEAMPDVKGTVTSVSATGDTVVLEVTWTGTHTGPLKGPSGALPATGKQQTTRSSWIMIFEGGKLRESRHYFDMLYFMQQLGLLPQLATA